MRRFVTLAVLLLFAVPFGISITGCHKTVAPTYCNGQTSGLQVGQLSSLDLEPRLTGISLNQGEINRVSAPSGKDCRGNSASTSSVLYASTNINLVDVAPTTGALCAGSWNRNTGAAIPDYTVCTPATVNGVVYVTASSEDVVSNPIPVFVHPVVTSIVLGPASTNCTTDPGSNCVDLTQLNGCDNGASLSITQTSLTAATTNPTTGVVTPGVATYTYSVTPNALILSVVPTPGQLITITGTNNANGLLNLTNATIATASGANSGTFTIGGFTSPTPFAPAPENAKAVTVIAVPAASANPVYSGNACVSQGSTSQLVARVYAGNGNTSANNISCLVGPLQFSALNASVVTIDANGVATAAQPGSSTISANISQASSSAGFFSTCPPASIVFNTPPGTTVPTAAISVNQNTTQLLAATVIDTAGKPITNLQVEYVSTSPTTIPAGTSSVTPLYPGAATLTAVCQPPTCNSAPFNEIGLFGNGRTVTSNPVQVASAGNNFSTVLYIASTQSQYLLPVDFTATTQTPPVRLPYAPNSMVISEDQSTLYMGTPVEIMTYSTASNALSKQDTNISGTVLAVSNDNTTVVVTDPVRQLIYLYLSSGGVSSEYGGVATRAQFSADSQTVYITTTDGRLLVHSTFTGWTSINPVTAPTDVAVTIPDAGAYLGGTPVDVRTNCSATTVAGSGLTQTTTNVFYPDLGPVPAANATRLASTNDGLHVLGATTTSFTDIKTNQKSGACPVPFTNTPGTPLSLAAASATSILNVLPTSDSAFAFVTYVGTGGVVPQYAPATGALTNIPLQKTTSGAPIAPISGVISADNNTLYVGTSGDNVVHRLTRGTTGFSDTIAPVIPSLPGINGGIATPDLLAQHPRKATS